MKWRSFFAKNLSAERRKKLVSFSHSDFLSAGKTALLWWVDPALSELEVIVLVSHAHINWDLSRTFLWYTLSDRSSYETELAEGRTFGLERCVRSMKTMLARAAECRWGHRERISAKLIYILRIFMALYDIASSHKTHWLSDWEVVVGFP